MSLKAFDKKGVLQLRAFASVADLPASPNPGQLCAVDDGTVTTVYQALRVGSSVAWEIVAMPISGFTVVRDDPSDTRLLDLSNDNGVTYPFEVVKAAQTVTTNPQSSTDNVIESVGGAQNPLIVIGSNGVPFLATGIGVPGIILRGDDAGSTTVPALRISRLTATTSPVSMDFQLEGDAPIPLVQQDGALVSYSVGALPTPGARWLRCIVYVTQTTFADGGAFICIQLADNSYVWKSIIYTPPPTPTGALGFFPALPPVGGSPVSFYMLFRAQGDCLPFAVPPGYEVQITPVSGQWFVEDSALPNPNHFGVCGADGLTGYTFTFAGETYTLGRLYIAQQVNFQTSAYDNLYYECQTTPYINGQTTDQNLFVICGAAGGDAVGGYLIAQVTVTPQAGLVITYEFSTGPSTLAVGSQMTLTSDENPFTCNIGFTTNLKCHWQVISQSGQVPYSPQTSAPGWRYCPPGADCATDTTCPGGASGTDLATGFPPDNDTQCVTFQGATGHIFTVTLQLDAIVP